MLLLLLVKHSDVTIKKCSTFPFIFHPLNDAISRQKKKKKTFFGKANNNIKTIYAFFSLSYTSSYKDSKNFIFDAMMHSMCGTSRRTSLQSQSNKMSHFGTDCTCCCPKLIDWKFASVCVLKGKLASWSQQATTATTTRGR